MLERARLRGNESLYATALASWATDEFALGNLNDALRLHNEALELLRPFGDSQLLAKMLHGTAGVAVMFSRFGEANGYLNEAKKVAERLADLRELGWIEFRQAYVALLQRDLSKAEQHTAQSLRVREQVGDRPGIACCLEAYRYCQDD